MNRTNGTGETIPGPTLEVTVNYLDTAIQIGLSLTSKRVQNNPHMPGQWAHHWLVRLQVGRRVQWVHYSKNAAGYSHRDKPTLGEVLETLIDDARTMESCRFDRKDLEFDLPWNNFQAVRRQTHEFKRLIGDKVYQTLVCG